ncbi:extensin-like, partial [Penaeus chinensis]|uniref:extensin-like n=1 Tax=Penaeus chinensis TaxID=139456 RepID=UPI001FB6A160
MRRVVERRQDNPEDIEDSKWRRKSYALAQHNALPVPMPLPAYPPPKVVRLPTTAPARRPRAYRPLPPTYRPANGSNRPLAPTPEVPAGMTRLPSHLPPTPEHPRPPEAASTETLAASSGPAVPVRRRNAAHQRQTALPSTPGNMDAEHLPPTPPLTSSSSSPPSPT